ncbi:MAG: hypothetical protein WC135_06075 [Bacteroidales bacterium]
MKRTITILAFFFALITASNLFAQSEKQDVLYLKSGDVHKGKVIETSDNYILFEKKYRTYKVFKEDIERIEEAKAEQPKYTKQINGSSMQTIPYRDPIVSTFMSFLIPGVGQIYNYEVANGVGFILWGVASQSLMTTSLYKLSLSRNDVYQRDWTIVAGLSAASYLICWITSMVDANKTSKLLNKGGLYSMNLGNNKTLSISPDLSLVNDYSKPNTSSSQASYGMKIKLAF